MTARITDLLVVAMALGVGACSQPEFKASQSGSDQSDSSEGPSDLNPDKYERFDMEADPGSPIRSTVILVRAGGFAGVHEALEISPSGKVRGAWMNAGYDSKLNAEQLKKIASALDASGLFKKPRSGAPAGSDLIWISVMYDGALAKWDELLAPDEAEKLLSEIATVLEKVK